MDAAGKDVSMNPVAALALSLLMIVGHSGAANASSERIDVPIAQTVLPDRTVRYSIAIRIGSSPPIKAMLDTGSNGIHVLPGVVPSESITLTGRMQDYGYGSGVKLSGPVANATVKIGDYEISAPVRIHAVDTIGCFDKKPRCPASRISQAEYGLGGDGIANQGFKAIVGTSMPIRGHPERLFENPLLFIVEARWIVSLPLPGQSAPGHLIINPDERDLAGYTMFDKLAPIASMNQEALPGCIHNENTGRAFCGPVLLDSGAVGVHITTPGMPQRSWPPGMRGTIAFNDEEAQKPKTMMAFAVGRSTPGAQVSMASEANAGATFTNAGMLPFFTFDVFYDAKAHVIGLKRR
jgi:hypothetical protein